MSNFRDWELDQPNKPSKKQNRLVGRYVESRVKSKKIYNEMEEGEADSLKELVIDFTGSGGVIKEVNGEHYLIETKVGNFFIHKRFLRLI